MALGNLDADQRERPGDDQRHEQQRQQQASARRAVGAGGATGRAAAPPGRPAAPRAPAAAGITQTPRPPAAQSPAGPRWLRPARTGGPNVERRQPASSRRGQASDDGDAGGHHQRLHRHADDRGRGRAHQQQRDRVRRDEGSSTQVARWAATHRDLARSDSARAGTPDALLFDHQQDSRLEAQALLPPVAQQLAHLGERVTLAGGQARRRRADRRPPPRDRRARGPASSARKPRPSDSGMTETPSRPANDVGLAPGSAPVCRATAPGRRRAAARSAARRWAFSKSETIAQAGSGSRLLQPGDDIGRQRDGEQLGGTTELERAAALGGHRLTLT